MEELAFAKDTLRAIKVHDNFQQDLKSKYQYDQQQETESIDGILAATNMITRAVAEHKEKNEIIMQLERELDSYKDLEKNYQDLETKYEESLVQKRTVQKELDEIKNKYRDVESELNTAEESVCDLKKAHGDIHLELIDIKPKYTFMVEETEVYKREAEFKIKNLEDQLGNAKEYEVKYKDRWEKLQAEYDTLVAELDARALKIDYLEKKLEEKYHLENLLAQMKEDYDDLRKEKHDMMTQSEQRIMMKSEEVKKAQEDRDEILRQNLKLEKHIEEKTLGVEESRADVLEQNEIIREIGDELKRKDGLLHEKTCRIDYYSSEISQMNNKILEFGELMEKLIAENQKMKIKLEENDRKESYFKRQMNEFSKIRRDMRDRKYGELEKLTVALDQFQGSGSGY